jgi:uncharacterized repeat protein (TIGR01451 family)
MGRRLIILLAVALTVVGLGVERTLAEPEPEPLPPPAVVPGPAPPIPPPAEPAPSKEAALPPPAEGGQAKEKARETAPPAPVPGQEQPLPKASPGTEPAAAPLPEPAEAPSAPMPMALPLPKARLLGAEPVSPSPSPEPIPPPAPLDPSVKPTQAPGALGKEAASEGNPLPPAAEPPGAGKAAPAGDADAGTFLLAPDQLPLGRQAIGLTVDVVAPATLNLNQTATLKIVVRNTGASDVRGVVVRDELPESLAFESSQPEAQRTGSILSWNLSNVPAGSERMILLKAKPVKVGAFDHAATVTLRAGGKSQTIVREPKLKVEQTSTPGKVLKGEQVKFKIAISNPGDGPARDVVVQAKISPGLRHEADVSEPATERSQLFEQRIDLIGPGQRVVLDTLVADTVLGGPQSCLVVVQSPDVTSTDDARSLATVTVVEPKLRVTLSGPKSRFTNTLASYTVTVENPGSSTARNVKVAATLPVSGVLAAVPSGARWNKSTGQLSWIIPQVEPGEKEKVTLSFQVKMGGIGFYQVAVESRAEGGLFEKATCGTDVTGLADVVFDVTEKQRSVDVGDETEFQIRIKNLGTKEATRLLVRAKLSPNLKVVSTAGHDEVAHFKSPTEHDELVFPLIGSLGSGKEMILKIKVQATKQGLATCRVFLLHDDMETDVDDVAYTRVTAINRQ